MKMVWLCIWSWYHLFKPNKQCSEETRAFLDHTSLALNLQDPTCPCCGTYLWTRKQESNNGHIKRNLPFPIYSADLEDRGLLAQTTSKLAVSMSTWNPLNWTTPHLHQGETTVILPLANPEIAIAFLLLQDYLLITNYSLSLAEIKPPLLTGRDSCASSKFIYTFFSGSREVPPEHQT